MIVSPLHAFDFEREYSFAISAGNTHDIVEVMLSEVCNDSTLGDIPTVALSVAPSLDCPIGSFRSRRVQITNQDSRHRRRASEPVPHAFEVLNLGPPIRCSGWDVRVVKLHEAHGRHVYEA